MLVMGMKMINHELLIGCQNCHNDTGVLIILSVCIIFGAITGVLELIDMWKERK